MQLHQSYMQECSTNMSQNFRCTLFLVIKAICNGFGSYFLRVVQESHKDTLFHLYVTAPTCGLYSRQCEKFIRNGINCIRGANYECITPDNSQVMNFLWNEIDRVYPKSEVIHFGIFSIQFRRVRTCCLNNSHGQEHQGITSM